MTPVWYPALIGAHIAAGTVAMLAGPVAVVAHRFPGRRWRRIGADGYLVGVLVTAATAAGMSVVKWAQYGWLLPMGLFTSALVLAGRRVHRRGGPAWLRAHGYGGSYVALVTALLVIAARDVSPWLELTAWVAPTAVGVPLILLTYHPQQRARWSRLVLRRDRVAA